MPRNSRIELSMTVLGVAILAGVVSGVSADLAYAEKPGDSLGGLQANLPIVPLMDPRPSEGAAAEQQWQTSRPPKDLAPVASFIDSLRGNDAAFEVILGQGRVLTTKQPIAGDKGTAMIAVGDPDVIDFKVLANSQMIRVIGKRPGVTDLSITTAEGQTYSFVIQVVYELDLLRAQLSRLFPNTHLQVGQIREHLILEGQARSAAQIQDILAVAEAFVQSARTSQSAAGTNQSGLSYPQSSLPPAPVTGGTQQSGVAPSGDEGQAMTMQTVAETGGLSGSETSAGGSMPQVINLIKVPGPHQVMLKVKIAELNRTALRQIGSDMLVVDPATGTVVGTNISGNTISTLATLGLGGLVGGATAAHGPQTTVFGIAPSSDFAIFLSALRQNRVLNIMAEPNLVAMSGQQASFLAGGQFPIPVPQGGGIGLNNVTIQFKDFGVQLNFIPTIMEDERIRLTVAPEVSTIDFALGTTLVVGGRPVPGLNTRKALTTVELREGQTLAIAGLMSVALDAQSNRIPGLGDLPYIGPFFSNNTSQRVEKELVVLVTPELVAPMEADCVPPVPGSEVTDPNDLEFYLMGRIEGRMGRPFRSTTNWDNVTVRHLKLEKQYIHGPVGHLE